jgi:hypothetical protein
MIDYETRYKKLKDYVQRFEPLFRSFAYGSTIDEDEAIKLGKQGMKLIRGRKKRYLFFHPESDSLFEEFTDDPEQFFTDGLTHDVTGEPVYESMWKNYGEYRPEV